MPIGIQDFSKIREGGFVYVDKTARVHQLISGSGTAFFLSRPRRFGKSLLCSTLQAVFEGRRELFSKTGESPPLAIDSLDWKWTKHPIIKLDLNPGNYTTGVSELYNTINRELEFCAKKYNVPFSGESISDRFARLINVLKEQCSEKVVVIIDEYDKPLLSTIDIPEQHIALRNELKGFYSILKTSDANLKFVLLTGVSKFSHVSVFSDLNHLVDLTLDPRYADLCGITQEEIEQNFGPEIEAVLENSGKDRGAYLEDLRRFYDGYRFSEKQIKIYNPFGLLNHFDQSGKFLPYWYETGTPTFLINLIAKQKINLLDLRNIKVDYDSFRKYDIENMEAAPLLYQTGYLTIVDYDEERIRYTLDYPNEEVRTSFSKSLIKQYLQVPADRSQALFFKLPDALYVGDIDAAMNTLKSFFASIPYDIIGEKENDYQTVIHLIFSMLGLGCRSEVRIAAGRIDTLVETKKNVYCFEFKLNGSAEEALAQINSKEYLLPWNGSGKELFKVGVVFDSEKRNIGEWKWQVLCLKA